MTEFGRQCAIAKDQTLAAAEAIKAIRNPLMGTDNSVLCAYLSHLAGELESIAGTMRRISELEREIRH